MSSDPIVTSRRLTVQAKGWTEKILPRRTPGNLPRWRRKTFLCGMGGIRARETGNTPTWAGEPAAVEEGGVDPRVHLPTGASPPSLRICSWPCDSPRHCPPQRYMHRWPANLPVVGPDSRIRSDDRRFGRERGSHGKNKPRERTRVDVLPTRRSKSPHRCAATHCSRSRPTASPAGISEDIDRPFTIVGFPRQFLHLLQGPTWHESFPAKSL